MRRHGSRAETTTEFFHFSRPRCAPTTGASYPSNFQPYTELQTAFLEQLDIKEKPGKNILILPHTETINRTSYSFSPLDRHSGAVWTASRSRGRRRHSSTLKRLQYRSGSPDTPSAMEYCCRGLFGLRPPHRQCTAARHPDHPVWDDKCFFVFSRQNTDKISQSSPPGCNLTQKASVTYRNEPFSSGDNMPTIQPLNFPEETENPT